MAATPTEKIEGLLDRMMTEQDEVETELREAMILVAKCSQRKSDIALFVLRLKALTATQDDFVSPPGDEGGEGTEGVEGGEADGYRIIASGVAEPVSLEVSVLGGEGGEGEEMRTE